jgi:phosphonate transport system substrate-binding protein
MEETMKKVWIIMLSALSIFLIIFSLTGVSDARDKCLVMGLIPAEDPRVMIDRFAPMKDWLEKDMGMCIEMVTATGYAGVIEAMRAKKVDFAWFGAFNYVIAHERAGAKAFAVGVDAKGKTTYHTYLVATPEAAQKLGIISPLEGVAGMKTLTKKLGQKRVFTFTFIDPASTSGFAVPRYFMYKGGMDPDKVFRKTGFIGTHDAAGLAVKHKTVDIAAIGDVFYHRMLEKGRVSPESNVVIWKSPPIPGLPVAYRGDLPENIRAALRNAIVRVPRDVVTGFGKITGYQLVTHEDYEVIVDMKKVIEKLK